MNALSFDPWGRIIAIAVAVVLAALVVHRLLRPVVLRLSGFSVLLGTVVRKCDRPLQFLLPLIALQIVWQGVPDDVPGVSAVEHTSSVLTIAAVTWLVAAALQGLADAMVALHPADVADNLQARRIQTQTRVLARIGIGAVMIAGLAFILMTFPRARQLGASLLASAGVAGLIVGLAARSVVGNLLAGLQIALAQPLRIDDVLIIEGEWGRVEEITATYVVLKIWDERRLVVPLQWFIEHPFQNWTRRGARLLGTVFLWVDYALPMQAVRAEARRLCEASANWDRRVCIVQVTDSSERAMQLRILVSSHDSGRNFDLRCEVREGLVDFIQRRYPQALPRLRADVGARVESDGSPRTEHAPESA
ncbi:MAG TPA: mechanosensitive ion channel domain-containing protein [Caldimonas sp.]|jgi:small-conductance mechanosensitive channel|nr:mechanosensitive ion channel domain-containing protein [Caldimonas sp.]HEX4233293.1 mechanosensitive ion channel domain-containing protein [Caldimonas sp.]